MNFSDLWKALWSFITTLVSYFRQQFNKEMHALLHYETTFFVFKWSNPGLFLSIFVIFKHKPKEKTVGVNRIRTRIVGSDDELADHLTTTRALLIYFGNRQWINWLVWRQTIKVGSKSFSRSSSASYSWQGSNFDLNGVVKETDAADKFKSEISAWKSSVSSYRCENDLDDGTNGKLNHQCLSV